MTNKIPQAYIDKEFGMLVCPKCVTSELEAAPEPAHSSQFMPMYDLTGYVGDDPEGTQTFGKVFCDLCGDRIK